MVNTDFSPVGWSVPEQVGQTHCKCWARAVWPGSSQLQEETADFWVCCWTVTQAESSRLKAAIGLRGECHLYVLVTLSWCAGLNFPCKSISNLRVTVKVVFPPWSTDNQILWLQNLSCYPLCQKWGGTHCLMCRWRELFLWYLHVEVLWGRVGAAGSCENAEH